MRKHFRKWAVGQFAPGVLGVLSLLALVSSARTVSAQGAGPECSDSIQINAPANSLVTSVETDGFSGLIRYRTPGGVDQVIDLASPPRFIYHGYTFPLIAPMAVILDEKKTGLTEWTGGYYVGPGAASLTVLEGKALKELRAARRDCYFIVPSDGLVHWTSQWIVMAKSGGGGGGGNYPGAATIEGFIYEISGPQVRIGKEGTFATVTVTSRTIITKKGVSATLSDLRVGNKAKAKYDASTYEALEIGAE